MDKRYNINDVLANSELGSLDKTIGNTLFGFNKLDKLPMLKTNTDVQGYTFFTKPILNLTTKNIRNIRQMYNLLSTDASSMQRFVRCTLDPRLPFDLGHKMYDEKLESLLLDKHNAFIPVLSNTLKSLSGWPDITVPTFTSAAGMRKEQFSMIDGTFEIYDTFDLSATFLNFMNEPLTLMFQTWLMYPALSFEGMLFPYLDFIVEDEFDYNTRIYRFITDESGRFIKKMAMTGASFPTNTPTGKFFDINRDTPLSSQTGEINISFRSIGALYNDSKIAYDFNQTSAIFHPGIRKFLRGEESNMEIIPYEILELLNFRGYPIINLETYELQWLIDKDSESYKQVMSIINKENDQLEDDLENEGVTNIEENEPLDPLDKLKSLQNIIF